MGERNTTTLNEHYCIKSIKTDNKQLHKKQLTIFDINYKK